MCGRCESKFVVMTLTWKVVGCVVVGQSAARRRQYDSHQKLNEQFHNSLRDAFKNL